MSLIDDQIAGTARPDDNGLLERIEQSNRPSAFAVLALISRCADVLERDGYISDRMEDDHYAAFTALDTLRGQLSQKIYEDETGITAQRERENAICAYHDERRYA